MTMINKTQINNFAHSQKKELVEIIDDLLKVNQATIESRTDLVDFVDDFDLNQKVEQFTANKKQFNIDPEIIYCVKTGAKLYKIAPEQIKQALRVHDVQHMQELMPYCQQTAVALHWMQTDGATLDKLAKIDPIGYFVYAASLAIFKKSEPYKNGKIKLATLSSDTSWLAQKVALNQFLQTQKMTKIIEFNSYLRDLHQINIQTLTIPWASLYELCDLITFNKLKPAIRKIIQRAFNIHAGARMRYSYELIADFHNRHPGISQFRAQKRTNNDSATDIIIRLLAEHGVAITEKHDTEIATSYTGAQENQQQRSKWINPHDTMRKSRTTNPEQKTARELKVGFWAFAK